MPAAAGWIVPPSVSLTRTGFRVWSPVTGLATFLEAATRSLSHDLGHLGTLRHELARLTAMTSSAHGRSRLGDLITYGREPKKRLKSIFAGPYSPGALHHRKPLRLMKIVLLSTRNHQLVDVMVLEKKGRRRDICASVSQNRLLIDQVSLQRPESRKRA